MGKNFYIADWHYDHSNSISFDNRLFFTVDEMNTALVNNWNSVVTNEDNVYILGDMFWKNSSATDVLEVLKGKKFLIKGNHDNITKEMSKYFEYVKDYDEILDEDKHVVLSHYPIPCFKNHYYGWYHLYGHVHQSFEYNMMLHIQKEMKELYDIPCNMFNVGCMLPYMDYTPRTLDEILNKITDEK